jgi:hypothetical protein
MRKAVFVYPVLDNVEITFASAVPALYPVYEKIHIKPPRLGLFMFGSVCGFFVSNEIVLSPAKTQTTSVVPHLRHGFFLPAVCVRRRVFLPACA